MATESENKEQQKNKYRHSKKTGFYYSFLTIILILCLIEIGAGAVINVSKIISYQGKKNVLENLLKTALYLFMSQERKMKPDYYEYFTCIADRCSFTCCREWKIGVD